MPSRKRTSVPARRSAVLPKRPAESVSRFGGRFRFIGDTLAELKKVTWLTRRETVYLTGLVLLVAVTVGVVLGLIDLGFSGLINTLLLGR